MGIPERWRDRPPLPRDVRERASALGAVWTRHGVLLAYLFGSLAREGDAPVDDVDLAFLPGPETDPTELAIDVGAALGTDRLDLVDLAHASPADRFEIVRGARLLHRSSPEVENAFELRVITEHQDREIPRRRQMRWLREGLGR